MAANNGFGVFQATLCPPAVLLWAWAKDNIWVVAIDNSHIGVTVSTPMDSGGEDDIQ
jgi:hypothetical protein